MVSRASATAAPARRRPSTSCCPSIDMIGNVEANRRAAKFRSESAGRHANVVLGLGQLVGAFGDDGHVVLLAHDSPGLRPRVLADFLASIDGTIGDQRLDVGTGRAVIVQPPSFYGRPD